MDPKPSIPFQPKQLLSFDLDRQVFAMRYSPCGKFLFGGGLDGAIRRVDMTGEKPAVKPPLAGHYGWITGLAFDPRGAALFTADSGGAMRRWPYAEETPAPAWSLEAAHDGWIHDLAISPDGALIATGGADGTVGLWSAADGKPVHKLIGHNEHVLRVRFHPDGKSLVSGDLRGVIKHWDVATGTVTRQLDGSELHLTHRLQETGGVRCLAFDAAGTTLAAGGTKVKNGNNVQGTPLVLLFDWQTGAVKEKQQFGADGDVYVCDLQFHAGGFIMAVTCGGPGMGKLLYLRPGEKAPIFEQGLSNCHSLSLHPEGRLLALATTNGGSNGNGRTLNAQGQYAGNFSPIVIFELQAAG